MKEKILNEYAAEVIKLVRDITASDSDKSEASKIDRLIKFIEDKDLDIEDWKFRN